MDAYNNELLSDIKVLENLYIEHSRRFGFEDDFRFGRIITTVIGTFRQNAIIQEWL